MNTRIAISSLDNNGLDSMVAQHFGHSSHFALADVEDNRIKSITTIENPFVDHHAPGQVPEFIAQQGATVMLSGGMGQRAVSFFEQYGIQVATGAAGTVGETIQAYLAGQLYGASPCVQSQQHHEHGE